MILLRSLKQVCVKVEALSHLSTRVGAGVLRREREGRGKSGLGLTLTEEAERWRLHLTRENLNMNSIFMHLFIVIQSVK